MIQNEAVELIDSYLELESSSMNKDTFSNILASLHSQYLNKNIFMTALIDKLQEDYDKTQLNNVCPFHFPEGQDQNLSYLQALRNLTNLLNHENDYLAAYNSLCDDYSRNMLIQLLAYKVLGGSRVKLTVNTPEYWRLADVATSFTTIKEVIPTGFSLNGKEFVLDFCTWEFLGKKIQTYSNVAGNLFTFLLEQYAYRTESVQIAAEDGDYIIDGGGCWGDTALYFSSIAGDTGKVFSFEFVPSNIALLQKNLDLNYKYTGQTEIVPAALWDKSGESVDFQSNGPASSIALGGTGAGKAVTITIDDFVRDRKLPRVDFIKMDIEGAELKALMGAIETIKVFKPKLAICIYHKPDDYFEIPVFLNSLDVGYRLYMSNYTILTAETILYAI